MSETDWIYGKRAGAPKGPRAKLFTASAAPGSAPLSARPAALCYDRLTLDKKIMSLNQDLNNFAQFLGKGLKP
jgi:hypothetical protein